MPTPKALITDPQQISDALQPAITVGGLREMIEDLTKQGRAPYMITLHPMDACTVIEELNDHGTAPDKAVVGFLLGVVISQHEDVSRGSARVVPMPQKPPRTH